MKSFTYQLSNGREEFVDRIRPRLTAAGIQLSGDNDQGAFSGRGFKGKYSLSDDGHIYLEISEKPFLLPWFVISDYLQEQLAK